jgi:hypothetical protein
VVVGLSLGGVLGYAWFLGRGLSFFLDDWNLVVDRGDQLLQPHFGHISLVPRALYQLLLAVFGMGSYTPFRLMGCLAFAAFMIALYLYLRARVPTWVAAVIAISFIWFSQSDLFPPLFAVLVNYTIPLALTVGVWALLDRDNPRADWLASALLGLALASSAVGLMAAVAVAVEFLIARAPFRRWLRFAPPALLWLAWYVQYHEALARVGSLTSLAAFTLREFNHTLAAFAGGSQLGGWLLALTLALAITLALRTTLQPAPSLLPEVGALRFTPRAAGALVAAVGFAVATALTRRTIFGAQNANVGRYLWVIGFFVVIALSECIPVKRLGPVLASLASVLLVVNGAVLANRLDDQRAERLSYQATTQPILAAVQAVGTHGNPDRVLPISLVAVHPPEFLRAVHEFGSPPDTTGRPDANPAISFNGGTVAHAEQKADQWMRADLSIKVRATDHVPSACRTRHVAPPETVITPGTLIVLRTADTPTPVKLRRYAPTFANPPLAVLAPHTVNLMLVPTDHSSVPWRLQTTTTTLTIDTCPPTAR